MYVGDYKAQMEQQSICIDGTAYVPLHDVKNMLDTISGRAVAWSAADFENLAQQKKGEDWEKYYDATRFEEALSNMIDKHDAEYGITWITVEFWLDELCKKNFIEEEEEELNG